MRLSLPILVTAFGLSGCLDASGGVDNLARNSAKTVVNGVVAKELPGVNAAPVTDCVIDNASASEIVEIAQASVVGTSAATTALVLDIAKRPDSVRCIVGNTSNSGALLAGL